MALTPAQKSGLKVAINFFTVVVAFWTADYSRTAFKTWQASRASKAGAPAGAPPAGGK